MSKRRKMGLRSHLIQDAHFDQNAVGVNEEIGDQVTRPFLGKQKATKSSKDDPRPTK
jgi:hypothetical protein